MARTADDLLSDVRARVAAPAANGLLSPVEILHLADEELATEVAELLINVRAEYWLSSYTVAIASGTANYRIPDRALGMGMRDVTVYDASGNEWNAIQVPADKRYLYAGANWAAGGPFAFTLENGRLTLLPSPTTSGYTLRVRYYTRPSRLVLLASAARFVSATATTVVMSGTVPSSISGLTNLVDVVRGDGMYEAWASGLKPTAWNGTTTLTIDASTPVPTTDYDAPALAAARADYVCLAGETVYAPVPDPVYPVLVSATCRSYCESIGDMRGIAAAQSALDRRKAQATSILTPRVDGEPVQPIPLDTPLRRARSYVGWR